MPSSITQDEEYLREFARSTFVHLPEKIIEHQKKRIPDNINSLIKNGFLAEENRNKAMAYHLDQYDVEKSFRPNILIRIQKEALRLLKDGKEETKFSKIPVGLLNTLAVNGFVIRTPFGGQAIALNRTLWLYLKNIFYCFQAVCLRNSNFSIGSHHSDETYVINIFNMIKLMNINNGLLIMVEDGEHSLVDVLGHASKPEKSVASDIERALLFIMLHEYGHIAHGHLKNEFTTKSIIGSIETEIYTTEHYQEFQADDFSALRMWGTDELSFLDNCATSIAITKFFFTLHFCEILLNTSKTSTHPPALERLNNILETWEKMTPAYQWDQIYTALDFQIAGLRKIEYNIVELFSKEN